MLLKNNHISRKILSIFFLFILSACSIPPQTRDQVLVRKSGDRHYDKSAEMLTIENLKLTASAHWDFAVMSENSYHGSSFFPLGIDQKTQLDRCKELSEIEKNKILERKDPRKGYTELKNKDGLLLKSVGWEESKLNDIILSDENLWCDATREALAFKIYERTNNNIREIAISFRGTVDSYGPNWRSNFRWFLPILNRTDANSVIQHQVSAALARALAKQYPDPEAISGKIKIYSTGHSLGGAFAQQFAYAFPPLEYDKYKDFKVKKVIVFNPSPVNGWYWVDPALRERNAGGTPISRVFQDGEILAYLRLSLSYVFPPSDGKCTKSICIEPKIEEIRYNRLYDTQVNSSMIDNHSMRNLAAGLATIAGHEPDNYPPNK